MSARYAIYFCPAPHSAWWALGAHWLGRDERGQAALVQPALAQFTPDELFAITRTPRRYGFHATLKAPFTLKEGLCMDDLLARIQALACELKPVALGPLQARVLGQFVALVPEVATQALTALAQRCVTELDALRAPLSAQNLARRSVDSLDARERELLQRYGYPYVLERFRLHFSLSAAVDAATAQRLLQALEDPVARANLDHPLVLDRLCLLVESAAGQDFVRIADVELQA